MMSKWIFIWYGIQGNLIQLPEKKKKRLYKSARGEIMSIAMIVSFG